MTRPTPGTPLQAETRYVSTAQVAQALGVSVTTVKRWVDDGILPAHRTAGGHRKLVMADVLRMVRDGNLPQADLSHLLPRRVAAQADSQHLARQFDEAVRAVDPDLIRSTLLGGYREGVPVEALADRVVAPALHALGAEWAAGRCDVAREHRVTLAVVAALYELRAGLLANAEKGRPVAVGGAPEGDHYILPTLLAELTLLDAGWDAVNLGPHTPVAALAAALDDLAPQLVWVAVSHLSEPDRLLAEYRDLYQRAEARGVAVVAGGQGLTEAVRGRMPCTVLGDGLTQLAGFARSLHQRPQRPKRGRPPGSGKKPAADGDQLPAPPPTADAPTC